MFSTHPSVPLDQHHPRVTGICFSSRPSRPGQTVARRRRNPGCTSSDKHHPRFPPAHLSRWLPPWVRPFGLVPSQTIMMRFRVSQSSRSPSPRIFSCAPFITHKSHPASKTGSPPRDCHGSECHQIGPTIAAPGLALWGTLCRTFPLYVHTYVTRSATAIGPRRHKPLSRL